MPKKLATTERFITAVKKGHINIVRNCILHYQKQTSLGHKKFANKINAIDEQGRSALWHAVKNKHVDVVKMLLSNDAELQTADASDILALCSHAIDHGQHDLLRLLLRAGMDANLVYKDGNCEGASPLHHATFKNDVVAVELLIKSGAFIDKTHVYPRGSITHYGEFNRNDGGYTALHFAASAGNTSIVELLLENGANVNAFRNYSVRGAISKHNDKQGTTALHLAAKQNHAEVARLLAKHGARKYYRDLNEKPPGYYNYKLIGSLTFIPHQTTHQTMHQTLKQMIAAIQDGKVDVVIKLLEQGVNPNTMVSHDRYSTDMYHSLLHIAATKGNLDVMHALLSYGAIPNIVDSFGDSPLHIAARQGDLEVIRALLRNNVNVNNQNPLDQTALSLAIESGCYDIAKLLLENKADANIADDGGNTPLHIYCKRGLGEFAEYSCPDIMPLLLKWQAKPNIANNNGETPICITVRSSAIDETEMLLSHGVDVNAVCSNDRLTPLHIAVINTSEDDHAMIGLLINHGANTNAIATWKHFVGQCFVGYKYEAYDVSPLQLAVLESNILAVKLLLARGVDVNYLSEPDPFSLRVRHGYTALHIAVSGEGALAQSKRPEMIRLLLEAGADLDARVGRRGARPIQLLKSNDSPQLYAMLRGEVYSPKTRQASITGMFAGKNPQPHNVELTRANIDNRR